MSRPLLALFLAGVAGSATGQGAHAQPRPDACATRSAKDLEPVLRFGCATAANLRAMVADPADLDHGRASTPQQGDAAFLAAHRHRIDQVKPLTSATASDSGGAGGAADKSSSSKGY